MTAKLTSSKMANTISVMTNAVRGVVSKKRIRYQQNGYDLDLAYVTDNLIAMGYPAENIESIFRNNIGHVFHFLEEKHKDHYKIYNLCSERHYDGNRFHGRVALYPFDDHNPPRITMIKKFCDDVDAWLKADKDNVAAVHCKAGKGRTGTMICCYLLHCQLKTTAESALTFYDEKRTKNKKGVTIPSQRRYVEYYAKLLSTGQPYEERTLQICEIRFSPQLSNQDNIYCSIYPNPQSENAESNNITFSFRKTQLIEINDRCIPLTGDVKIEVYRKVMKKKKERVFHFWFNTFFVCDNATVCEDEGGEKKFIYELSKYELDDAHKDTEHKTVPQDFKVQLAFKTVPKLHHHTSSTAAAAAITYIKNDGNSHHKTNHNSSTKSFGPQQNHHPHYNQMKHSNNVGVNNHNTVTNSILPRPNPSNNINNISDHHSTMTNQRIPNASRLSSVDSGSSRSSIGDQQQQQQQMHLIPSQSSLVGLDASYQPNEQKSEQRSNEDLQKYQKQAFQRQHNSNSVTTNVALRRDKDEFGMSKSRSVKMAQSSYQDDNGPQLGSQLVDKFSMDSNVRDSMSASTVVTDLHTPSVSSDVSRTNSSSRSSSINSSCEVSSQSACCGGDGVDEEEDWESELCRMESSTGKRNVMAYQLGRKYSDNIVMMSSTTSSIVGNHPHIMPMSMPSSTSSLLSHMIVNSGDNVAGAEDKNQDNKNDNDDDSFSCNSGDNNDDNNDDDDDVDDDILRTLILSSPPSSIVSTNKLMSSNHKSKPILIEPSTSHRRHSNVPLSFGLRSLLTRSFCRRSRREST